MKSKRDQQSCHTAMRLKDRYDIRYTQYVHDTILAGIYGGRARLVDKQSNRVTVFDVDIPVRKEDTFLLTAPTSPVTIRVVYDRKRKSLATVLAPDMDPATLRSEVVL